MSNEIFKSEFINKAQIQEKIKEVTKDLNKEYKDKDVVLIGLLKGAFIFLSDLSRKLTFNPEIEFVVVKSYDGDRTTGAPQILLDLKRNIANKHVLIVEDIIDTGTTLAFIAEYMKYRNAASVKIVTLLNKKSQRQKNVHVDWSLFDVGNEFLVGYGLDYNEKFRNLNSIMALSEYGIKKYAK